MTYDLDASCPRWHSFINEVMCNDQELTVYQTLPQLIELWGLNVQTQVNARKKLEVG